MKLIFSIENLDCAHCAAEIERKIQELEEIESASLSFATKQLHIVVSDENGILERIQHAADMVEEGVVFKKADSVPHHDHGTMLRKWDIIILITGISLYVLGLLSDFVWEIELISHIFLYTAYLILGFDIIVASVKNISKGQFFDEKFLMCIATIGALVIGCPEEAVGVMVFFRIGQLFEHIAIDKSRKTIMDAIDFRPETVQLLKDGQIQTIPAADVRIGDILTVRAGDRIPVDGIIHKGTSSVDTSAITGESIPLEVCAKDAVMSGCINLSGVLELEATATLKDSMVTRILESVENAAAKKPKIDRFITRFSKVYTPSVVVIAILTAIVPSIITGNAKHWIYTALNFLMISCPCALVLSVPLAYFCGIGVGSRRGILFKDGISLEILADIKAVVMDKTGTLTNGRLSVSSVQTEIDASEVIAIAAALESASTHPVAYSIIEHAKQNAIAYEAADNISETAGKGITGKYHGHQVLCGNQLFLEENNVSITPVAECGTTVYIARDGVCLGCIILKDQPKSTSHSAIKKLNEMGMHTVMLTGDNAEFAKQVAEELKINEVQAQLLPDEKLEHLKRIRNEHGKVLFVGDGINDSPVLSGADVGAAMGSGADAAMEAADILFLTSDPEAIVQSIRISKRVAHTSKSVILFAIAIKLMIMILGFLGFASMWLSVFADTGVTILCVIYILFRIYFYKEQH